jgi:hypothetical protein
VIAIERFAGGRTWLVASLALGVLGLVASIAGFVVSPADAYHSYLVAFVVWVGISVGAALLLAFFHASAARWVVVLRRPLEVMAAAAIIFVPLFIPIILGREQLYATWLHVPETGEPWVHHLRHKLPYLNLPFFIVRAAIYFGIWGTVGWLLFRWSVLQDVDGDPAHTVRQRRLGAGAIPLLGLSITFAAFDWIMSLEPLWQSTIFGMYYFAGSFLGAICVLQIATAFATGKDAHGRLVTQAHLHSLGKLMLAFVAFWAYMAFSQLLLIWIANLPEEAEWYTRRITLGWKPWAYALALGQFILPFFALLARELKLRRRLLAAMAVWLLAFHYLDLYWLVMPTLHPHAPVFHWTAVVSFVGVGGIAVAFALWLARGRYAVPIKDPYLAESLRYVQP